MGVVTLACWKSALDFFLVCCSPGRNAAGIHSIASSKWSAQFRNDPEANLLIRTGRALYDRCWHLHAKARSYADSPAKVEIRKHELLMRQLPFGNEDRLWQLVTTVASLEHDRSAFKLARKHDTVVTKNALTRLIDLASADSSVRSESAKAPARSPSRRIRLEAPYLSFEKTTIVAALFLAALCPELSASNIRARTRIPSVTAVRNADAVVSAREQEALAQDLTAESLTTAWTVVTAVRT
jgi:hypothetical protein